jgi:lysine 2,3-aminomutase
MALPEPAELESCPGDLEDPVGETGASPVPFVVRKHRDRAVFLATARCHVYCRFCFRRGLPDRGHRDPTEEEAARALDYCAGEPELREVILSGGDPLTLPDERLRWILRRLAGSPHLVSLRVHTRAPVHDPTRVTPELADVLSSSLPLRVVLHVNHPRELTPETRRAVTVLLEAGIPLLNQTVLLAGVNDDAAVLETLCRALLRERIEPYYLHHPDRAVGSGSFRVSLERGLACFRELEARLAGGPALPSYVIDLPDGSGKVPVESLTGVTAARD